MGDEHHLFQNCKVTIRSVDNFVPNEQSFDFFFHFWNFIWIGILWKTKVYTHWARNWEKNQLFNANYLLYMNAWFGAKSASEIFFAYDFGTNFQFLALCNPSA